MLYPVVDLLAGLTAGGAVLEFAVGTGRVALPLRERGVEMRTARVPGEFALVYPVWNGITNVTTQDKQIAVFGNAAEHLVSGGRFVVEVIVPQGHKVAAGESPVCSL